MIESVHIEDLGVIQEADLAFGPGLTALTGGTGARPTRGRPPIAPAAARSFSPKPEVRRFSPAILNRGGGDPWEP